jgi:hypothetical protein
MADGIVTRDLQMERETLQVLFGYPISTLCVRHLWHGRRQADNPYPPILAAADQVLLCWPPRSPDLTPWGYVKDSISTALTTGSA